VLRAKKIGTVGAGMILTIFGLIMVWVTYVVVRSRNSIGEVLIAGVFALLLLAGGVGLLRSGLRNKDRLVFDRRKVRKLDIHPPFSFFVISRVLVCFLISLFWSESVRD
jgi:hypothetical protein